MDSEKTKTMESTTNDSDIIEDPRAVILKEKEEEKILLAKDIGTDPNYKLIPVWKNVIGWAILHFFGIIGFWYALAYAKWSTLIWTGIVMYGSSEGVTIGAHRLYSHKGFKAKPLLKAILILLQTVAGQNCMFIWVRDHRLHHRYSDTDADPHNAKRGFFFSHIGWLMFKKHPKVIELGRTVDLSDLEADWMVMFQKKYYKRLYFVFAVFIPVAVPIYFFNEHWRTALFVCYFFRYIFTLNGTWLVNSAAHIYGTRPYDKDLQPVESHFVAFISSGEGWHNYHHAFPWDYKAAELGMYYNSSAAYIRFFERIGLAYDLRDADSLVKKRVVRTGDGTHHELGNEEAKKAVDVMFPPFHPLNPTYNTTLGAPDVNLKSALPLVMEEALADEKISKDLDVDSFNLRNRTIGVK